MIGIVINYDNDVGSILGSDNNKYLLLKKDIMNNIQIKNGDKVIFSKDVFKSVDATKYIARFIRLLGEKDE